MATIKYGDVVHSDSIVDPEKIQPKTSKRSSDEDLDENKSSKEEESLKEVRDE